MKLCNVKHTSCAVLIFSMLFCFSGYVLLTPLKLQEKVNINTSLEDQSDTAKESAKELAEFDIVDVHRYYFSVNTMVERSQPSERSLPIIYAPLLKPPPDLG